MAAGPREGASEAEIHALESTLQVKLPEDLVSLYGNHNGAADRGKLPWRLLPTCEAEAMNAELRRERILPPEVSLFWTDDEGDFAGIYFAGPLTGNVCFIDHEDPDFTPRFKTLKRFLNAVITAAKFGHSWREMPSDYPCSKNESDAESLQQLLTQFRSVTDFRERCQLAFDIMALTPLERTADLLPFLDDEDLWVQERAAEHLGKRRYAPAIPLLVKVAQRDAGRVPNAQIGAIVALGRMKSAEGLESLLGLADTIQRFHSYIIRALELHGCSIKFDGDKWKFRLPRAKEWKTL